MNAEDFDKEFDDLDGFFDETSIRRMTAIKERENHPTWLKSVRNAAKKKAQDPKWKENNLKANQNRKERLGPQYSLKMSQAQKRRYENMSEEERIEISKRSKIVWENEEYANRMRTFYSTPEYKEYITAKNKQIANCPEWREKVSKLNKDKRSNPDHIKKHQDAINKRTQDPEWRKKQAERSKPIMTPDGLFKSRKDAAEFYKVKTPVMNARIKRYPDQYYYIDKDGNRLENKKKK